MRVLRMLCLTAGAGVAIAGPSHVPGHAGILPADALPQGVAPVAARYRAQGVRRLNLPNCRCRVALLSK